MNIETEELRNQQEQGTRNPTGSGDISDRKSNSSPIKENKPPRDISKKNPPQGTDSQSQGQQRIEDEKRRAS
jgi:hypothetical protein